MFVLALGNHNADFSNVFAGIEHQKHPKTVTQCDTLRPCRKSWPRCWLKWRRNGWRGWNAYAHHPSPGGFRRCWEHFLKCLECLWWFWKQRVPRRMYLGGATAENIVEIWQKLWFSTKSWEALISLYILFTLVEQCNTWKKPMRTAQCMEPGQISELSLWGLTGDVGRAEALLKARPKDN